MLDFASCERINFLTRSLGIKILREKRLKVSVLDDRHADHFSFHTRCTQSLSGLLDLGTIRWGADAGGCRLVAAAAGSEVETGGQLLKHTVTLAGRVAWSGLTPFRSGQAQDRGNGENSVPSSPCLQAIA
jgi:hypothetical protein